MTASDSTDSQKSSVGVNPLDVCTLGPDGLADRVQWIRQEITSHAVGKERMADGIALEITAVPGMQERVDHWISLERDCCAGIRFERHPGRTADQIRVEIHGVKPDGQLFSEIPDLMAESEPTSVSPIGRILRAGGLGAAASVFFLCILPLGIATFVGAAAVAAPLAALDNPLWIGIGAVVGGGLAWTWMGRRHRTNE